jgi:hypothetical protein
MYAEGNRNHGGNRGASGLEVFSTFARTRGETKSQKRAGRTEKRISVGSRTFTTGYRILKWMTSYPEIDRRQADLSALTNRGKPASDHFRVADDPGIVTPR